MPVLAHFLTNHSTRWLQVMSRRTVTASATHSRHLAWRTRGQSYKPWHHYWRIQYLVCNSHFHKQNKTKRPSPVPLPAYKLTSPFRAGPRCFGPIISETEKQHIQGNITSPWATLEGELPWNARLAVCCTAWLILYPGSSMRIRTTYEVC